MTIKIFHPSHLEAIQNIVSIQITNDKQEIIEHTGINQLYENEIAQLIVYPSTNNEISNLLKYCNKNNIPVVPFGSGTSLEGQVCNINGGISLDMKFMNRILSLNPADFTIKVQAGIKRNDIDSMLNTTPFFFPAGPGINATIGGIISTRASGANAVRYGTIKENIVNLTVVLPNGEIIKTGTNAPKSATGYDLSALFCGAEGTLGVITEATLKLTPRPSVILCAAIYFENTKDAINAVIQVVQKSIPIAQAEFLDREAIKAINNYSSTEYPEQPAIFFEFHGTELEVKEQMETVKQIVSRFPVVMLFEAKNETERKKIWNARINAYYAINAIDNQLSILGTDNCVPISKLIDAIQYAHKEITESGLHAPIIGHVGDGNFHAGILFEPKSAIQYQKAKELAEKIAEKAIQLGGSCSGEHGIGIGKLSYMNKEHGKAVSVMHLIKKAIDPNNIMNPGKLIPSP